MQRPELRFFCRLDQMSADWWAQMAVAATVVLSPRSAHKLMLSRIKEMR